MKKLLISLMVLMMVPCFGYDAASKVSTVGKNLITKNSLPNKTTFEVVDGVADNSNTSYSMVIKVSKDELKNAGNDNEVAAVVAHKIGEVILGTAARNKLGKYINPGVNNQGVVTTIASNRLSMADNKDADILGVDMMINASYNPLASIVVLTKEQASAMEAITGKPANEERAMNIFNYLSYNFPDKVKSGYNCQEYRAFLAYAQPIVDMRNADKKKLAKFQKEQAKQKQKRAKKINQYKTTGGLSGWDATYTILNGLQVQ